MQSIDVSFQSALLGVGAEQRHLGGSVRVAMVNVEAMFMCVVERLM